MGLLSLAKTADQAIYEATCLELVRELSKNLAEDKPTKESFTSINGLDKAVQEINFTTGIKNLFEKYHNGKIPYPVADSDVVSQVRWERFTRDIEIMKIGNHDMSINQAMEIAGNLYNEVGHEFYGMLLSTKGNKQARTIFNPLHPVMVAELKKENSNFDLDAKSWSIAIYSFKPGDYSKYAGERSNTNFIDEIATIVTSINSPANYVIENSDFNVDIEADRFVLKYKETKRERDSGQLINEESGDRNYIIPSQIINVNGVAYPYYGVTYSRRGLAWNLTPMYAANINHPSGQSTKDGMAGGSRICTHSGNSKTQMGLSSLNHCNTTSPLNSYLLTEGSMTYAEQSLRAGLEMFLGNEFKEHGAVAARVLTYQEFLTENNGNGGRKGYLAYIKQRLDDKMDEVPMEVVDGVETPEETEAEDEAALAEADLTAEPTTVWTNGAIYNRGQRVTHEGLIYTATVGTLQTEPRLGNILWHQIPLPWVETHIYSEDETVLHNGRIYVCVNNGTILEEPSATTIAWVLADNQEGAA